MPPLEQLAPPLIRLLAARLLVEDDYRVLEVKDRALTVEHRESGRHLMIGCQELPQ